MGNISQNTIFVGFRLVPDEFFTTIEIEPQWCQHPKPQGAKFCPVCGRARVSPGSYLQLRPEIQTLLEPEDARDVLLNGTRRLIPGFEVLQIVTPDGTRVLLAGVSLVVLNDSRYENYNITLDLPSLPNQQRLLEAITKAGFHVLPDSFGLHVLTSFH